MCFSLEQALEELDDDRKFLTAGEVFSDDLIDAYMELKEEELTLLRKSTHPVEFQMYYSLSDRREGRILLNREHGGIAEIPPSSVAGESDWR